jgi:predicted HAD superfamily Cof-like phosphohydrolase
MFKKLLRSLQSEHQKRVGMFAHKMGFTLPDQPIVSLSDNTRELLAALILEEVYELVWRGLKVRCLVDKGKDGKINVATKVEMKETIDIEEIVDGVCDVKFVATKILCLLGVPDEPFQREVDMNNLMKFAEGHHFSESGKLKKPADHPKPNIRKLLESLKDDRHVSFQ